MKHAYLIMAHGEPYILERLLKSIDDERNDIFLHADRKWHNFDAGKIQSFVKKSRLFFTPRLDIRWGAFSQIECELSLLKMATGNGKYAYYHLLSGVDMPLARQDKIHQFFEENSGKEFVAFDYHDKVLQQDLCRVKYFHPFVRFMRLTNRGGGIRNTSILFSEESTITQSFSKKSSE